MDSIFSRSQLDLIRSIAQECHGTGEGEELAVFTTLGECRVEDWDTDQLVAVQTAAEECARLKTGALSVYEHCARAQSVVRAAPSTVRYIPSANRARTHQLAEEQWRRSRRLQRI